MGHDHAGHGHTHGHGHSHVPAGASSRTMGAALGLTLAFVVVETVFGWRAHSLGLLSDAGHNLADAAALAFSWYAIRIANRPAHHGMTFGYHRVGIFAALANALSLVVIALLITWEVIARLRHPAVADGGVMMGVAAIAVVVNLLIGAWLQSAAKDNINVRSAYLHMLGDAVSAFGVVIAGAIVLATRTPLADPVVAFLIAGLILWTSWGVLRESAAVLLEGTPQGMDMRAVASAITDVAGVINVHDLHVWMVGPGVVACSCHIIVAEQSVREGQQVLRAVVHEIEHHFGITHTTVQVEVEGCEANDMYCTGERPAAARRV
jgi:cobalt-zinc-cadmium efflux system protein